MCQIDELGPVLSCIYVTSVDTNSALKIVVQNLTEYGNKTPQNLEVYKLRKTSVYLNYYFENTPKYSQWGSVHNHSVQTETKIAMTLWYAGFDIFTAQMDGPTITYNLQ